MQVSDCEAEVEMGLINGQAAVEDELVLIEEVVFDVDGSYRRKWRR